MRDADEADFAAVLEAKAARIDSGVISLSPVTRPTYAIRARLTP